MKSNALVCAVAATVIAMYGCTAERPYPFDPATMQRNNRAAAEELPQHEMRPMPTTMDQSFRPRREGDVAATQPAELYTGLPVSAHNQLPLTLQQVIQRTVNNSMDIRVAGYEPAITSQRLIEAESRFDPTFFVSPFYEWREPEADVSNLRLESAPSPLELWGVSAGIRQELETGGTAEIRHETNSYFVQRSNLPGIENDFFSNNLVGELRQPLLRNFGSDVNRARITVARNDQRISLLEYRRRLEETLFDAERTYWELALALRQLTITEDLLARTITSAERTAARGREDATRVNTSQTSSAVQLRRSSVISARNRIRELSDRLKRLMNDPELPVSSDTLVIPSTPVLDTAVHFDAQEQINQALEHRLELAQQLLRIENGSTIVRVAKSNMLPELNLVQTLTVNGVGTEWDLAENDLWDFSSMSYRVGLQFEIPIGNRQARAIYQRTVLQRQQAIDQYRAIVEQVALDVKDALRNVRTAWEQMEANREAVFATLDTLDAVTSRTARGGDPLTPTMLQLELDTQARVAEAQRSEAEAMASYAISVTALERAKGTLLRYNNVMMEEDRLVPVARGRVLANVPPYTPRPATRPAQ